MESCSEEWFTLEGEAEGVNHSGAESGDLMLPEWMENGRF